MLSSSTILLIEQDRSLGIFLSSYFRRFYTTVVSSSVRAAWEWMQSGNIPNLIIADIALDDRIHQDFILALNHSSFFGDIPIVVLKPKGLQDHQLSSIRIAKTIEKPFDPIELKETVDSLFTVKT